MQDVRIRIVSIVLKYSQGIWLSMEERYGKEVTGVCKICEAEGITEMHHIISQSKIKKMNQPDLLTNPNNIIELCKPCHKATDSHIYFRFHWQQEKKKAKRKSNRPKGKYRVNKFPCNGITKTGRSCRARSKEEGGFCGTHQWQAKRNLAKDQTKLQFEEE